MVYGRTEALAGKDRGPGGRRKRKLRNELKILYIDNDQYYESFLAKLLRIALGSGKPRVRLGDAYICALGPLAALGFVSDHC